MKNAFFLSLSFERLFLCHIEVSWNNQGEILLPQFKIQFICTQYNIYYLEHSLAQDK